MKTRYDVRAWKETDELPVDHACCLSLYQLLLTIIRYSRKYSYIKITKRNVIGG